MDSAHDLNTITDDLRSIIVSRLNLNIDPNSIPSNAPLFAGGDGVAPGGLALDSIEALEIVVGIEEKWGIAIQDDSVASEFYSLDTLSVLVGRLLAEGAGQEVASV